MALAPRGFDLHSAMVLILIPIGFILVPISLVYSYRIEVTEEEIRFYMFLIPVRMVKLDELEDIRYEKRSDRGQPCVLTVIYPGARYSYPVKLFNREEIDSIIHALSEKTRKKQ